MPVAVFAVEIEVFPESPIQGEPVMVTLIDVSDASRVKSAYFEKQLLNFFNYKGRVSALAAIDLSGKVGTSTISVTLNSGDKILKEIVIEKRPKIERPIDIPQKIGGNTKTAVRKLVTNLIDEQAIVGKITSIVRPKVFWKDEFRFPLSNPIVTDNYGYSRDTVGVYIAHKGTDFRASIGTPILAINRGVVRDNKVYPTFGRIIIVDHGFGLYVMYLHLSKTKVNVGELVLPGQVIGFAGDSGYATGSHLHLTIRINGISIDPIMFYKLFNIEI